MPIGQVKKLQRWFADHVTEEDRPYTLDSHQAAIVLDCHKNCLVTARAGSGKTRTLVAKIIYLIFKLDYKPEEIIAFTFNKKAATEVNDRLLRVQVDGHPLLKCHHTIATTFHSFAYKFVNRDSYYQLKSDDGFPERIARKVKYDELRKSGEILAPEQIYADIHSATSFISRAEQKYYNNYAQLNRDISQLDDRLLGYCLHVFNTYRKILDSEGSIDFYDLLARAIEKLSRPDFIHYRVKAYRFILIDEYQDFSAIFQQLIEQVRKRCPEAHLLAVGDDWQAINGFAGSDVCYFQHFEKYFPEDCVKLYIPTNYRSGRHIVKNANYFMANSTSDYNGCKAANKTDSHIHLVDLRKYSIPADLMEPKVPLEIQKLGTITHSIIRQHPGQSIKILHRNNMTSVRNWSLHRFTTYLYDHCTATEAAPCWISTVHKSKGLEADVVILLEATAGVFPHHFNICRIFDIFDETPEGRLLDEERLFYVALTRAKKHLYILTNTPPQCKSDGEINLLSFLNPELLDYNFQLK